MYRLNFTDEDIVECVKAHNKKLIEEEWEVFKVYNNEHLCGVKMRRKYTDIETPYNEDGYKYDVKWVNLNNTREYLFFLAKGYDVASLFNNI